MSKHPKTKNKNDNDETELDYIQIDHKNKIEELSKDDHIILVNKLLQFLSKNDDNIGAEINRVFQGILPESKETDPLKLIISISSKTKIDSEHLENCLNEIMNRPENNYIILTKELGEQLSTILKEIFKKIKKNSKIKNFSQINEEARKYINDFNQDDILKKYKIQRPAKIVKNTNNNDVNVSFNNSEKILRNININNNFESSSSSSLTKIKKRQGTGYKNQERPGIETLYKFKKFKEDNKFFLPVEMLILIRKFNMITKIKFTLNNNTFENNINNDEGMENNIYNNINNSGEIFEQNDLQNIIYVLLNIDWLFANLCELEVDFSNDNLTESEINLYKYYLKKFSKLLHKDVKITTYNVNSYNKRYYDPIQKSLFSQVNTHNNDDDSDKYSSSMTSNNLNYSISFNQINNLNNNFIIVEEVGKNTLDNFIKKYKPLLEMIIVYGFFIRKMSKIMKTKFILPLNLGDEIFETLRRQKIMINDFHFLSFLNNTNIIRTTIDFNSLDSQTFEKLIFFLNQNQLINVCNLSFFPPEEYFKTELLFKILQKNDEKYKLKRDKIKANSYKFDKDIILDLRSDEDLDTYILRKISKNFEKNIKDLFYLLTIKTCIYELSLIFDFPTILVKNGLYNNILMKFFLNIFIFIDKSLNNIQTLSINAENFIFDSRKNPILNDFFDKLTFYLNQDNKLTNLTFQVRFYSINNIYRLIPYNLTYLSLGSFDYETFNCFVDYITSGEFSERSKLNKLQINLNNSVFQINKVYDDIIKLYTKYPKELTEISMYSFLCISYKELMNLLKKTNYNTLSNIFLQFNAKSILKDKQLEEKLECDITNADRGVCIKTDNLVELYKIKRNKKITGTIINLMMRLNNKNKGIMNYNIFTHIEKFLCSNERKKVIIQFRR